MELVAIFIFFWILQIDSYPNPCDRSLGSTRLSETVKSNNGKYLLEIQGKPDKYVPNERYEITIKLDFYVYSGSKFGKFFLHLESQPSSDEDITEQPGKFELGRDGLSRFSHDCPNTIQETNSQPKIQVQVIWVAPPPNSGCVTIKAIIIEIGEKRYADDPRATDGYLTKTLCESLEENEDSMPDILETCCACEEAKYELAFQGNWIRNNHPKDFPEDPFTTKFSDIIGASHNNNYDIWNEDQPPSDGLKELAFNGSTRSLESKLMDDLANLHTIIKARGLSYPNITSNSFAIFRVDSQNHLVSVVSKMMPSPDWIVGVSKMELCLSNCSWKQFRSVNLYPKDVGIDDAVEYNGSEPSTNESPLIQAITATQPADPKSPFYDDEQTMKPIAKLQFRLQKIYKKQCEPVEAQENHEEKEEEEEKSKTVLRQVSTNCYPDPKKWSSCSVDCGKGHQIRDIEFKGPNRACQRTELEIRECESPCESGEKYMYSCPIVWTDWTPRNAACQRERYRETMESTSSDTDDEEYDNCPFKEVVKFDDCKGHS